MELYNKCMDFLNKQKINIELSSYEDAIKFIYEQDKLGETNNILQAKLSLMKYELLNAYKIKLSKKFLNNIQITKDFTKGNIDLYMPFDTAFITYDKDILKDRYVLIQKLKSKIKGTDVFNISIMMFSKEEPIPIIDFLYTQSKASRIYISCKMHDKCKYANISNIAFNSDWAGDELPSGCMKTYRTKDLCELKVNLESVYMTFQVIKTAFDQFKIRDYSKVLKNLLGVEKRYNSTNEKDHAKTARIIETKGNNENYIYVRPNSIQYINATTKNDSDIKGSEKSEHYRSPHKRKLRNGNVIDIKGCKVKEGCKKTNYKI